MVRIQAGSVDGVTWARRQRTKIQARNGLRRVWPRTFRRVSRVRWVFQEVEADRVGSVLLVWIFCGGDILALDASVVA